MAILESVVGPRYTRPEMQQGTFRFPYERQQDYTGTVTFRPIKYTPPEINAQGVKSLLTRSAGNGILSQLSNGDTGVVSSALEGFQAGFTGIATGGRGTENVAIPSLIENPQINQNEYGNRSRSEVDRSRGVVLYLPASFQVNDQISYEGANLGTIGAIGIAGIQAGQGAANALARGLGEVTGSTASLLGGNVANQRGARLAAARLAEAAPIGEAGAAAVKAGFGATVNPNTINLFKSVNLRNFVFTFTLIANSEAESVQIDKIVKFFRMSMYPDTINFDNVAGGLNVPIGYEFPDKFEITLRYNGYDVATKILPSSLRDAQVTYNPSSMGWHKKGYASEVNLTLSFGEERTLTRKDIYNGY
jgi:hypothetical protein